MKRKDILTLSIAGHDAWKAVSRLAWEVDPQEFVPLASAWLDLWPRHADADALDDEARHILDRMTVIVAKARDTRVVDAYDAVRTCEQLSWTIRGMLDTLDALRTYKEQHA